MEAILKRIEFRNFEIYSNFQFQPHSPSRLLRRPQIQCPHPQNYRLIPLQLSILLLKMALKMGKMAWKLKKRCPPPTCQMSPGTSRHFYLQFHPLLRSQRTSMESWMRLQLLEISKFINLRFLISMQF